MDSPPENEKAHLRGAGQLGEFKLHGHDSDFQRAVKLAVFDCPGHPWIV